MFINLVDENSDVVFYDFTKLILNLEGKLSNSQTILK